MSVNITSWMAALMKSVSSTGANQVTPGRKALLQPGHLGLDGLHDLPARWRPAAAWMPKAATGVAFTLVAKE